jgi:hypothetical protein
MLSRVNQSGLPDENCPTMGFHPMRSDPMKFTPMKFTQSVAIWLVVAASASAAEKFTPNSGSLPVPRPTGAVQLLGPGGVCEFVGLDGEPSNWILADDVLTVTPRTDMDSPNHIVSTFHFRDADMHVEFLLPEGWTGNSGLYLHGLYELQILNSFGTKQMSDQEMGALYKFHRPLVNASKPHSSGRLMISGIVLRAGTTRVASRIREPLPLGSTESSFKTERSFENRSRNITPTDSASPPISKACEIAFGKLGLVPSFCRSI